jgi:hypothetical protein
LEESGSNKGELTLAVLVIVPESWGATFTLTVAFEPDAIVPSEHVTVPLACEQLPCDGVADWYVTPAGSVSVTCTPVALEGPPLAAVSV